MSGGIDSTISALFLKKEGYDVEGLYMKLHSKPGYHEIHQARAQRAADFVGVKLHVIDLQEIFNEKVFQPFIDTYAEGKTPNPCALCNRSLKFGEMVKFADNIGADFVATGHYAQVARDKKNDTYRMLAGIDATKDQSYFLWTLGQAQLSKTFFPIGGFEKARVRALAKKFGIPVADKKDSQGLCFMGKLNVKDFLAHFIEEKEGSVVNEQGETIGVHRGAYFYTLGERHGFTIIKKTTEDAPYYVVAKDLVANTVTVAHNVAKKPLECASQALQASQVNFCRGTVIDTAHIYTAQVRYHGEFHKCTISTPINSTFSLHLEKPAVFDVGQSVVLYDGNECLGGGVIE